jgi:hypothetical protein
MATPFPITLPQDARLELGTDRIHHIVVPGLLFVKLHLLDWEHRPLPAPECALRLTARKLTSTADADGRVVFALGRAHVLAEGLLTVGSDVHGWGSAQAVELSPLPSVEDPGGQRQRLDNLGYVDIELGDDEEAPGRWAIEEFQCEHDLVVDGVCGPQTRAKLLEVHGH